MKTFKRIISFFVIAALASALAISAFAAPEAGTKYEFDLSLQKASSERFYLAAIDKNTGALAPLEDAPRATWSEDWPGIWIKGAEGDSDYVFYKSEKIDGALDQMCGGAYKSVIAFKAPADGKYNIYYSALKYQIMDDSFIDVVITNKNATTPYASKLNFTGTDGEVIFDLKDIMLAEGEEVWVIVTTGESNGRSGNSNLVVRNFDVTFVEAADVEPLPELPTPNPNTADNLALTAAILALAAAGVVIASKKRR